MSYPVNVAGLSPQTTEAQLHDFFTFCGKIQSIDFNKEHGTATIKFEKGSSAKTALMLNGGALDGATLKVTSDVVHQDEESSDGPHLEQSDKPRAGIAAEYLAKGYKLSDHILERAIDIDNKQGISKKFLNYIHSLDTTIGEKALGPDQTVSGKVQATVDSATQQARSVDQQRGISKTANDFYSRAIQSPIGQKVLSFYTSTSKQVRDIHEEARRIAEEQKAAEAASATTSEAAAGAKTTSASEKTATTSEKTATT